MDLSTYILQKGGTGKVDCPVIATVATAASCAPGTLYLISRGLREPSAKLARRIHVATDNAVGLETLRSDIFGPAPQKEAS